MNIGLLAKDTFGYMPLTIKHATIWYTWPYFPGPCARRSGKSYFSSRVFQCGSAAFISPDTVALGLVWSRTIPHLSYWTWNGRGSNSHGPGIR